MYIDEDYFRHINNNEFIFFPEEWIRCSDFFTNVKPNYFVSSYGRVFNTKTNQFINPIDSGGSLTLSLRTIDGKQKFRLHRLVMMCFKPIENSNSYDIKHLDGNKFNNNIDNLVWISRSDNMKLSFKNGGSREHLILENSPQATLTNNEVHIICKLLEQRKSYPEICEEIGKECDSTMRRKISEIKCGTTWKEISHNYNIPKSSRNDSKFTLEQAESICEQIQNGLLNSDILKNIVGEEMFNNLNSHDRGLYYSSINNIRHKKSYKDIVNKFDF